MLRCLLRFASQSLDLVAKYSNLEMQNLLGKSSLYGKCISSPCFKSMSWPCCHRWVITLAYWIFALQECKLFPSTSVRYPNSLSKQQEGTKRGSGLRESCGCSTPSAFSMAKVSDLTAILFYILLSISGFCSYKFDWWVLLLALSQDLQATFHLSLWQHPNLKTISSTNQYWSSTLQKLENTGNPFPSPTVLASPSRGWSGCRISAWMIPYDSIHDRGDIPNSERNHFGNKIDWGVLSAFVVDLIRNLL